MSFGSAASTGAPSYPAATDPCPCGGGRYGGCCGPLISGEAAPSAERLMRSRYTAFALGDAVHLARSWHPATRPDDLEIDPATRWRGLQIVAASERDDTAEVSFRARWRTGRREGVLAEKSRFARRAGRWVYVDGDVE